MSPSLLMRHQSGLACARRSSHGLARPAGLAVRPAAWQTARVQGRTCCQAVADGAGEGRGDDTDLQAVAANLNALLARSGDGIDGKELRRLVFDKFGRTYEVRLTRLQGKMYLQVMWKFLEQRSFHLSEQEYMEQLDAVAEYLTEWGVVDTVRRGIMAARRPPGYTGGGNARCISIPLAVDLGGGRSAEWQ